MATQKDVAKLADVSFITVSRVINNMGNVKEETREKVLAAIKELNYYPNSIAQGLNRNKVNTLAIQAPIPDKVSIEETSYYRRILIGIEKYCIERNYDMLLSTQRGGIEEFDYLKPFYERKADGIALLGASPTDQQCRKIQNDNIPCIIVGDRPSQKGLFYIDTDNFNGLTMAVEYLLERAHTKIAYIKGNVWTQNAIDRFRGYKTAIEKAGIPLSDELIFKGEFSKQSGALALNYYMSLKEKPTAIIASTDLMAIGVYEEARKRGYKIPEDFSLFGFDGHEICNYTSPPLATIEQPLEKMGEEAARLLIDQIESKKSMPRNIIFPVILKPGKSIADLR